MKDIRFRAREKVYGSTPAKWVFGYLAVEEYESDTGENYTGKCIIFNNYGDRYESQEILEETVGQYIGHVDINGVDIYEGDIVKNSYREKIFIVEWDNEIGGFTQVKGEESYSFFMDYVKDKSPKYNLEIIGNIYGKD